MKSVQIKNSYRIWRPCHMRLHIKFGCKAKYDSYFANEVLHRSYLSMYIEWWLHNIGYYLTKPFCFIGFIKKINLWCRDVDLEEH